MEFMSSTIQGLPAPKLAADEADFLATFFIDRLKDSPLMISSIVSAFDALTRDGANLTEKSFVQITRWISSIIDAR